MDPNSKQMISGLKLGYDSLVAVIGEENAAELREILDEMTEIAENNDYATFMDKASEKELFDKYNEKMDELSTKMKDMEKTEGVKERSAGVQELETMRKQYQAMLEHARANPEGTEYLSALEELLAVMDECSTAPQFSKLAEERGLFYDIGRSALYDTYSKELKRVKDEDFPVLVERNQQILAVIKNSTSDVEMHSGIQRIIYKSERKNSRYMYKVQRLIGLIGAINDYYTFKEEDYRYKAESHYYQNIEYYDCDWDCLTKDPDFRREYFRGRLMDKTPAEIEEEIEFCGKLLFEDILKEKQNSD